MFLNRSHIAPGVSLFLSYLLVMLLCLPFTTTVRANLSVAPVSLFQEQNIPEREGELLVRFRGGVSQRDKDTILATLGVNKVKELRGGSGFEKVELSGGRDAKTAALELLMKPQVEFAEPNFLISKNDLTPNDAQFNEQWALRNTGQNGGQYGADINASGAWPTTTGSGATVIAVIDSGIDFTHPDLANNQWTNINPSAFGDLHGWDYITDNGVIKDEQGHGTAIAGIIAAEGNNSAGVSGVMWRASLMSLRVLDQGGNGDIADAVEAIDYAVTNGAQVINLSWGTAAESMALKDAIQRAIKRHVVVVCSAGNGGKDLSVASYYPASFNLKGLIAVAASDNFDQLASWSNWGAGSIDVAAPGANILTTRMGGGYWTVTGTSAAAPLVSGIAGLMKTIRRSTNAQIISKVISEGARPSASLSGRVSSGGVADAANALAKLQDAANQAPPFLPPGGNGHGGNFTTPPPPVSTESIANLPNLDEVRNAQFQQPSARIPIQSNLICADCDPVNNGNYPNGDPNFSGARTRPPNQTGRPGVNLGSRNFNWSLPLLSLRGRAGLDLNLAVSYNSLVWTKDGSLIKFNADFGTPAPGFRLGLPILQQRFLNSQTNTYAYMMVTPSGGRIELRQVGTNTYESQDSSYTHLDNSNANAIVVRTTDGTQFTFEPANVNNEFRCTKIKDRNGNYISATYNATNGHLLTIKDTLDRVIYFDYDANSNLQAIRQTWAGNVQHLWATFEYMEVYVAPAFGGGLQINGPNNQNRTVLSRVNLHDGTYFTFEYNAPFAQVKKINSYAADGHLLSYTSYNVSSNAGQTDCPRFTERRDWAENWNDNNEAITTYSAASDNSWAQQTAPDGTIFKQFFATSGWQTGLPTLTEVWSANIKKKWTTVNWTQDDLNLSYQKNPRVTETNVWDEANNRRRVTIDYYPTTSFSLPSDVYEYAANGTTVLRRTHTNYQLYSAYTDRRIIGLVFEQLVYDGAGALQSKTRYHHDWAAPWLEERAGAKQHDDTYYGIGFVVGRANLVLIERWDVNYPDDTARVLSTKFGYNTTGSLIFTGDGLWHRTDFTYTDSFSDNLNHSTFAYPTTITDPDTFASTVKYNYDLGTVTRTQDPKGAVQTITYDSATRVDRITNEINGAYVRNAYAPSGYIASYATIQNGAGEALQLSYFDGAGHLRASGGDHPGSSTGFAGTLLSYDVMGRLSQQTNPAEINSSWIPSGDDVGGWASTLQTYDWKGRPVRTTNQDSSYRENTYGGCGCAGGEQITVRDERGRRKRYTKDVLGRLIKVEELNWDQTVYSTTNYSLNARDQITQINQAGQTRTFSYDGYGRLSQCVKPEQGTSNYTYFSDDTVQTVTDARGATSTFGYNNRGLTTSITYGVPAGVAATPNVTFGYDSAGNRTSMVDGLGSVSYAYNPLSQLQSETRTFTGVGTYTLTYGYNLAGQLNSITNPWSAQVGYGYDKIGRLTNVSGSGYGSVSSYVNSMAYRAFGLKQMVYNNGRTLSLQYDNRMRLTQWNIPGVMGWNYSYLYFGENTGRVTYAQNITDPTLDRSYNYDHVGRLQSAYTGSSARAHVGIGSNWLSDGPYAQQDNVYDVWGNTLSRTGWGGTNPQYGASYTNNKMNGMTYDNSGNLTDAGGGWMFTYDATGQQATSAMNNVQMYYDGDRLRGKKSENGTVTYYLRSSVLGGQVVAEISWVGGVWTWTRGYVYLGGEVLAVQQSGVYWMHQDPVAKSKRVTGGSGAVVSTIELDPWGGETNRSSSEAFQPRKFTTYEQDSIGSHDAMNRRYNRWWARFEQPDPYGGSYDLTSPQSFNRYSYVHNDPVNFVDPSGLNRTALGMHCTFGWVYRPHVEGGGDWVLQETCFEESDNGGSIGFGGFGLFIPQKPKDALPFDNCNQFVDFLADLAAQALKNITDTNAEYSGNAGGVASALGQQMMKLAQFGYERHIHNKADGFKDDLVKAGQGQPGGEQGAGVYGHVLGQAGAFLDGILGPFIGGAAVMKDYVDYLRRNPQAPSEISGNVAGRAVGEHMWNYLSGNTPREIDRLKNSLRDVLCK